MDIAVIGSNMVDLIAYITRMPAQAGDHEKRIESRWELSCRNPKEVACDG